MQLTRSGPIRIALIHGPNLNMLGVRDPDIYGKDDFESVNRKITAHAKYLGVDVTIKQSNSEARIVDFVQEAMGEANAIVINPGAYTHYSYPSGTPSPTRACRRLKCISPMLTPARVPAPFGHFRRHHRPGRRLWALTATSCAECGEKLDRRKPPLAAAPRTYLLPALMTSERP